MSHQRIIGIIILLCITLLFIPILKTTQKNDTADKQAPQIMFPEPQIDKNVTEITVDTHKVMAPESAKGVDAESTLQAPDLPPLSKPAKPSAQPKQATTPSASKKPTAKKQWVVQIASIKASNIISLTDLKLALKNAGYQTQTKTVQLKGKKWVRFYSTPQANLAQATNLKNALNKKLKKYRIHAVVKSQ